MEENTTASLSVFVTGATEGLGRDLLRQLVAQGYQVSGVATTLADANLIREDGGLPVYCDLLRAGEIASAVKMAKVDVIVNAAPQYINGLPLHHPDWDYYIRLLRDGAAACAEGASAGGAKFLVHISGTFVYGDTEGHVADESASVSHDDPLFVAAREGEQAVLHGETPACVLRAGFNYGPGSDSLLALHRALINRGMLDLGSSEHAVWVHEADLARAAVLAVEKQPAGEILNVTDGNDLSPLAFAQAFASSLGVPPPRPVNLPGFVRQFTGGSSALLTTSVQATSAKAAETLDWSPQYADIASGLEQTLLARRAAQVM